MYHKVWETETWVWSSLHCVAVATLRPRGLQTSSRSGLPEVVFALDPALAGRISQQRVSTALTHLPLSSPQFHASY